MMKKEQRDRIVKRHKHSIWMHGHSPKALYWENRQVQELRFDILLTCGIQNGDSVLDVGCGFADLAKYLKDHGLEIDYTGIDLSPDMIEKAKLNDASLNLFCGDFFDFNPTEKSYDWILLSGALNEPLKDNGEYLKKILPKLFQTCRKGLAFNLLNGDFDWPAKDTYILQAYKPAEVLAELKPLSEFIEFRNDYLPTDVSYFVWRENPFET
jgi:SAM-dependent methyltransferase